MSQLSAKDFWHLANIFAAMNRHARDENDGRTPQWFDELMDDALTHMANFLEHTNPDFKREKFIKEATR